MTDDATVCSTPFGDIDECTRSQGTDPTEDLARAQRLSATLMNAPGISGAGTPGAQCAQRLSATLMNAPARPCAPGPAISRAQRLSATLMNALPTDIAIFCSTACAQRLSATLMNAHVETIRADCQRPAWCSTPFGDIDECTARIASSAVATSRAQRLSATLMNARFFRNGVHIACSCSTPFGDIDECTRATAAPRAPLGAGRVLNAFRRH